ADKIVVMNDGLVEQIGAPLELYDRPANLFVAGFIGSPALHMTKRRLYETDPASFISSDGVKLPAPAGYPSARGKDLVYGIRPEGITPGGPVELTVQVVEPTGAESHIVALLGETQVSCVFRERLLLHPGERLQVSLDPGATHLFDAATGRRLEG